MRHPPNGLKYDYMPPRRRQTARGHAPEVHVAVNITPTAPGPQASVAQGLQASYIASDAPIVMQAPTSGPAVKTEPEDSPAIPPTSLPPYRHTPRSLTVLLDCIQEIRVPSTLELLTLMDAEDPAPDLKYVDVHSDLMDHELFDILEINSLPVELLATFGCLGMDGAARLHRFAQEKFLRPLGLLEVREPDDDGSIEVLGVDGIDGVAAGDAGVGVTVEEEAALEVQSVEEVRAEVATRSVARPATESANDSGDAPSHPMRARRTQDDIVEWLDEVHQGLSEIEEIEEEDEVDELDVDEVSSDGWRDRASQEV